MPGTCTRCFTAENGRVRAQMISSISLASVTLQVFGCYTSESWKVHPRYYGSGESFVFQVLLLFLVSQPEPWDKISAWPAALRQSDQQGSGSCLPLLVFPDACEVASVEVVGQTFWKQRRHDYVQLERIPDPEFGC